MKSIIVFVIFTIVGIVSADPVSDSLSEKKSMKKNKNCDCIDLDEVEAGVMTVNYLHVHGGGNIHVKTGNVHVESGNIMVGGDIMIGGKSLKEFMNA